jgi:hypothetical protein
MAESFGHSHRTGDDKCRRDPPRRGGLARATMAGPGARPDTKSVEAGIPDTTFIPFQDYGTGPVGTFAPG